MKKTILILMIVPFAIIYFSYAQSLNLDVSLTLIGDTCYDGLQNQNETGIDCGGPCGACEQPPDGGSGGGNGGSGIMTLDNSSNKIKNNNETVSGKFQKNYFLIKDNEPLTNEINISDFSVYLIELKLKNSLNNVTIEIEKKEDNLPIGRQSISMYEYQVFKISATNIQTQDIGYFKLWLKIPIKWIKEKNVSFDNFVLLNYRESWEKIDTEFISNDGEYYYFKATSSSLGYFSIIGEETQKIIVIEPENASNPMKKFLETPGKIISSLTENKNNLLILFICLAVIILSSLSFVYFSEKLKTEKFIKDKEEIKKKEDEKEEKDFEKKIEKIDKKMDKLDIP